MRTTYFLFALLFASIAFAQLPDSLEVEFNAFDSYERKVEYLDSLAQRSLRGNQELYLKAVKEGINLSLSKNDDTTYLKFRKYEGTYFTYQDQLDTARFIFNSIIEQSSDSTFIANVYSEIGITYYYESNDAKALEYFVKSYKIFEKSGSIQRLAALSNNIGTLYRYLEDYDAAVGYFRDAIKYKLLVGDSMVLGSSYHNMGIAFDNMQEPDSALKYFVIAKDLREKYDDKRGLSKSYVSLSTLFENKGQLDSAKYYIRKSIQLDQALGDEIALIQDKLRLGEILAFDGYSNEVIRIAEEAAEEASDVRMLKKAFKLLAEQYEGFSNFEKANYYRKELGSLNDSLYKAEKEASLQELQVQFDTEQKEAAINQLTADNKIKDLQAKQDEQTRLILVIVLIGLFVIAILLYARFRSKAKTNALLDAKNQELAKLNQTKDRLFSIISHDLKSPLASFHLITKSLSDNLDSIEKEQLREYLGSLRDSSSSIKEMMDNLLKWALAQTDQLAGNMEPVAINGIIEGVVKQLDLASAAKSITIETNTVADLMLQGDASFVEIVLRNLLSNSLKFTPEGKTIKIETASQDEKAILRVTDEGVGMDQGDIEKLLSGEIIGQEIQNSSEKGTGLGVTLVNELVKKMNGQLSVITQKGIGTTFEISFDKAA